MLTEGLTLSGARKGRYRLLLVKTPERPKFRRRRGTGAIPNLSGKRTGRMQRKTLIVFFYCIEAGVSNFGFFCEKEEHKMLLQILDTIDGYVWGLPMIILLIATGIFLTIRLQLIQVFKLPFALRLIFKSENKGAGDVSSFKALCTALAATVGTGNIVGVATAVKTGGPGALFWMWVAAFFGMATKYAECLLAVRYRKVDANGNIAGGPMHYIEQGLGPNYKWLAVLFAIFGLSVGLLGIGTFTQVNSISDIVAISTGVTPTITDLVIACLVGVVTIGGLQSISKAAAAIVPSMALIYFVVTVALLCVFADKVPGAIALVINEAFTGSAATGGFLGASVMLAMRSGVARGIFSNESGLGSAPIVAAAAKTNWSAEQGLISMTGTFIDTIIICTMTGLSLIVTDAWTGPLKGAAMTNAAFCEAFPAVGTYLLTIALSLFAFTTILGWNYYSERCCEYLFGVKSILPYRILFVALVALTPFFQLEEVWCIADICNGLMAFPNLVALLCLSGVVVEETKKYTKHLDELLKVK